jgi:hypothetical protein
LKKLSTFQNSECLKKNSAQENGVQKSNPIKS